MTKENPNRLCKECLKFDYEMNHDERLSQITAEIAKNHRQILDDWCKAYLAQIYQETGCVKPGDFILNERDFHEHNGKLVKTYWFELKKD